MKSSQLIATVASVCFFGLQASSTAQIVINEFQYDDVSTDDREFVELYNTGAVPVDIGNWSVGGRDAAGANTWVNIPAGTTLAPGAYYVIGNSGVLNVNQVQATGFLENDAEQLELWTSASGTGTLMDGVVYEGNKGATSHGALSADMLTQVGAAVYWPNHQAADLGSAPSAKPTVSVARHMDGLDSNNNGRDFGMRPATPGTANNPFMTTIYAAPNVDALADGTVLSGMAGSFVGSRVITPGTASPTLNPNAIPAPPVSSKAIIAWDNSGGGNAVASDGVFNGTASYNLSVYFDTRHISLNSNASNVKFTGSEQTMFGLGGGDALANLADVSTKVGLGTGVSANGASGVMWYYEKVGESGEGLDDVSQKLYLVDAGDGGNGNAGATTFDWIVLATIDLANAASGWYRLALAVSPSGAGVAIFDNQVFPFTTSPNLTGEFFITYRENAQLGSATVPDFLRPPTYAEAVPEPSTLGLAGLGALALLAFRRRK